MRVILCGHNQLARPQIDQITPITNH